MRNYPVDHAYQRADTVQEFLETRPFDLFTAVVLGPIKATLQTL